jgi:RNA polymerase primary sigma factor
MTAATALRTPDHASPRSADLGQLHAYFRDVSHHGVMSAADEIELANAIFRHRLDLWRAILAYPPFTAAVTGLIELRAANGGPSGEIAGLRVASRALRDRDTRSHETAFVAAWTALAGRMVDVDVDGLIADEVAAELDAIAAGDPGPRTLIITTAPRHGSRPFDHYLQSVRAAHRTLRAARARFVEANLRLVVVIARRYNRGCLPLSDLIQEGNLGLMKAVGRFDPAMGCRFSTYGSWWIRHAITRALADKGRAVRVPVHLVEASHRLTRARHALRRLHVREPTIDEVAAHTGLTPARIERIDAARVDPTFSLDSPFGDHDRPCAVDLLADCDSAVPGELLDSAVVHEHLREVLTTLRPLEADILRQRFGLTDERERTLREIADQYSLSRERIRQLQEQALAKIRDALRRRSLV